MDNIKKVIEEIPLPSNLHEKAYVGLLQKKKRNRWMLPTAASLFLLLFTSSIVFSDYLSIADFFEKKEQKLAKIEDSTIIVQAAAFTISLKDFVDYKENTLLIHQLNNYPYKLTDLDLIHRMIDSELLLLEAKKHGFTATDEEISDYALQVKEAFSQNEIPSLDEINEAMAKKLQVSVEDYFTHPTTLKQYEELLTTSHFVNQLYADGVLNSGYQIEEYQEDLRKQFAHEFTIFEEHLNY